MARRGDRDENPGAKPRLEKTRFGIEPLAEIPIGGTYVFGEVGEGLPSEGLKTALGQGTVVSSAGGVRFLLFYDLLSVGMGISSLTLKSNITVPYVGINGDEKKSFGAAYVSATTPAFASGVFGDFVVVTTQRYQLLAITCYGFRALLRASTFLPE